MTELPDWLVPGALVETPHLGGYSGPHPHGTFHGPYVIVRIKRSKNFGGGVGVCLQTTGKTRRYLGEGKWVGIGLIVPAKLKVEV